MYGHWELPCRCFHGTPPSGSEAAYFLGALMIVGAPATSARAHYTAAAADVMHLLDALSAVPPDPPCHCDGEGHAQCDQRGKRGTHHLQRRRVRGRTRGLHGGAPEGTL